MLIRTVKTVEYEFTGSTPENASNSSWKARAWEG